MQGILLRAILGSIYSMMRAVRRNTDVLPRAIVNPGQLKKVVGAVPVVSSIVAPILGPGQTTTQANPPAQTPSQPQPPANGGGNPSPGNRGSSPNSPSSPSNPGSGTGTPGTSGGGNPGSGTGTPGTPSGGSPGSGTGSPGTPSGGSPGSGTGLTVTSSGGNPGTGTGTTGTSGGGNPVPPAPGSAGTVPGTSSNGLPASVANSTTINNGGGTGVNSNSTSPTSGGSTPGVVVNVGNTPNNGVPNAGTGANVEGGRSGSSTSGTRSAGNPSDPSASATDVGTLSSSNNGTRRGPVAASIIVPLLLLLIALVIFVLRRRSRARREEQAIKWWFTRNRTSRSYDDNRNSTDSFGTAIDHSSIPHALDVTIPPPPPMAEIGRPNGTAPALVLDLNSEQNRFSIGSANSHTSQFLVVHHRESLQPAAMKSYTESFSFPKPPGVDRSSLHSRGSERSLADSPKMQGSPFSPISSTPDLEVLYVASPVGVAPPPLYPILAQPQAALITSDPFGDNNPFDDPALATVELKDSAVEIVRRPFSPQLGDELQINIGEFVRIIQTFDDGWALVAKTSSLSQGEVEDMQGLIPIDCLREPDQTGDLGLKRTTSRGGVHNV